MGKINNPIIVMSGEPNLQNKAVTITQNETRTYTADNGYDGLASLEVTTNVPTGGGSDYERPADWLPIPDFDTTKDDIYILFGVSKNGYNTVRFNLANGTNTATVDWGDGNSETHTGNYAHEHTFNYDNIPSSSWTTHNNTRQVIIHISGDRGTIIQCSFQSSSLSETLANYLGVTIYQINANVSACAFSFNGYTYKLMKYLEIVKVSGVIDTYSGFTSNTFYQANALKVLEVSNWTKSSSTPLECNNTFREAYSIQNIDLSFFTLPIGKLTQAFNNCRNLQTLKMPKNKLTSLNNAFNTCSNLMKLVNLETSTCTDFTNAFQYAYRLGTLRLDMSSITTATLTLSLCIALKDVILYNFNPTRTNALTIQLGNSHILMTAQSLVNLFNSVATNVNSYSRTIALGSTLQGLLANVYVKDSGNLYSTILPTSDDSIVSGKEYYTYDDNTDTFTRILDPDLSSNTLYYEKKVGTWNEYVVCESTDTGAMLALDFITTVKGYTIT